MTEENVENYLDKLDIGKRIAIEVGTELQLEIDGVAPRVRSELIGMEPGSYFIVKTPTLSQLGGIGMKLYAGNRVVVRYVYRGSAYGFETTILDSIATPVRLLFLTCPKVVVERNIRSDRRIDTALPAKIGTGDQAREGTVTDISAKGCHFRARVPKGTSATAFADELNKEVILAIQLPGVQGELNIKGKTKNIRKDGDYADAGIEFLDPDEKIKTSIEAYIGSSN